MIRFGETDPELPARNKACYMQLVRPGLIVLGFKDKDVAPILSEKLLLPYGHPDLEVINSKTFEKKQEHKETKRATKKTETKKQRRQRKRRG